MTTTTGSFPALASTFVKAWAEPPEHNRHQLTHAVESGFRIAVCGMSTGAHGGSWPADTTLWDSPLGRCPVCARVVYGSHERRS
jgi:hypothetical protein